MGTIEFGDPRGGPCLLNPGSGELSYAVPFLELRDIDDAATMRAITDPAVAVPGFDLEYDALRIDLDDPGNGADGVADRRCGEMADFHVHADADEALRQV